MGGGGDALKKVSRYTPFNAGGYAEKTAGMLGLPDPFAQEEVNAGIPAALQGTWNAINSGISNLKVPRLNLSPTDIAAMNFGQGAFSGLIPRANNYVSSVLGGDFLRPESNPYLQATLDKSNADFGRSLSTALNAISSTFGLAGQPQSSGALMSTGANITQNALRDQGLNIGQILAGNYANERALQNSALSMAGIPFQLAGAAGGLGNIERDLAIKQLELDQIPISLQLQLLSGTPLSYPSYAPSIFEQLMGGIGQVAQTGANLKYALA